MPRPVERPLRSLLHSNREDLTWRECVFKFALAASLACALHSRVRLLSIKASSLIFNGHNDVILLCLSTRISLLLCS
jgi:hypothetical protein